VTSFIQTHFLSPIKTAPQQTKQNNVQKLKGPNPKVMSHPKNEA